MPRSQRHGPVQNRCRYLLTKRISVKIDGHLSNDDLIHAVRNLAVDL
jgi:hypothetical protein